jgi:hypothetical protein
MPSSSNNKAKANELNGRAQAGGLKAPGARAQKRAAKSTQAAQNDRLVRHPAQDPSAYAPSTWGTQDTFEVTVPSGQKCLCRELSIERLIEMGLLQSINSLEAIVGNEILPRAGGRANVQVDMGALMQNADKLTAVLELVNTIVCEAVVAPQVHPVPAEGEARVQGLVYVDSIGMQDRFAIFSETTGNLEGLASFR